MIQSDKQNIELQMCGNDISTVTNPNADFYTLVTEQIASRKIALKNYPINTTHTLQLNSLRLDNIVDLSLQKCRITHQTLEEMSRISFPVLRRLNLNDNEVGPIGCRVLVAADFTSHLTELSLNNNKIRDVGVKNLSSAQLFDLEDLSLGDNGITSDGLTALQGKLKSLSCLSLGGNKLNDKSVAVLKAIYAKIGMYLKLSRNQFTDEGLKQVLGTFPNLQVLMIDRNKIREGKDKYPTKAGFFLFY